MASSSGSDFAAALSAPRVSGSASRALEQLTRAAAKALRAPHAFTILGHGDPLCARIVRDGRPLALPDVREDGLVRDHPGLGALGVVALVAAPLLSSKSDVLGALFVTDRVARDWTPNDLDVLCELAAALASLLEVSSELEARRGTVLEGMTDPFVTLDDEGRLVFVNAGAAELFGRRDADLLGQEIWSELPEELARPLRPAYEQAVRERIVVQVEEYSPARDRWFESRIYPHEGGLAILFQDVDQRKRARILLTGLIEALETITRGEPLTETLGVVALTVEELSPGAVCSILLLDAEGQHLYHGAGPSMPAEYNRCVNGLAIGPDAASCGTAAHRREPVIVADIATDPRWARHRDLADPFGFKACWSFPILDEESCVLGTFALHHVERAEPSARHLEVIERAKQVARLAIERDRREATLRANLDRLLLVQRGAGAGIWDWDLERNSIYISPQWKALLGYSDDEFPNTLERWTEAMHPGDVASIRASAEQGVSGQLPSFARENRLRHKDGAYRWFIARGVGIRDAEGRLVRLLGMNVDVTETRRTEARSRRLFEANLIGIVYTDLAGLIRGANDSFLAIVGYTRDEVEAGLVRWETITAPEHRAADERALAALRAGSACEPYEKECVKRDGRRVSVLVGPALVDGSQDECVAFVLDLTERKRSEDQVRRLAADLELRVAERTAELTAANERLMELDRLKSEFLATMSHELRTPLNSIIGFTGILRQGIPGPVNAEQRKQLDLVHGSGKHLLGLINDLLDLSRIEAGKLELDSRPFDFATVVAEVAATLTPMASMKRLGFVVDLPGGPMPMVGDRKRIFQVLLNLVNNAIKFTEKGEVRIVARAGVETLQASVVDTGIGIRPEDVGGLFVAFRQVDGSARRVYEGTGLGLHLCRRLLEAMSGKVGVETVFGQGSRFSFEVPLDLGGAARRRDA